MELIQSLFGSQDARRKVVVERLTAAEWVCRYLSDRVEYRGAFAVYDPAGDLLYSLDGLIIEWRGCPTDVYVHHPPAELRRLPEGPCLQLVGDDWFKLHWQRPARSFEQSRAYVEDMLAQMPRRVLYRLRSEAASAEAAAMFYSSTG